MNPINIWCVKYLLCFVNCYIYKIRRSAVKFLIFPHRFYNFRSPTTFSGRKTPKSGRKMSKTEIWISNHFPIGKSEKNPEIFRFRSSPKNDFPTENWSLVAGRRRRSSWASRLGFPPSSTGSERLKVKTCTGQRTRRVSNQILLGIAGVYGNI